MTDQKAGKQEKEKPKTFLTIGKRKKAVARAVFTPGTGLIRINNTPIDMIENEMFRSRLQEPLMIAGDKWRLWNIRVNVMGGFWES